MPIAEQIRELDRFAIMGIPVFNRCFAPNVPPEADETPTCSLYERCKDCPYPAHGFVCWHDESRCLRTEIEKIHRKKEENHHAADYESGTQ